MYTSEDLQNIANTLDCENDEFDLISRINNKCKFLIDESKKLHQEKKVLKIMRSEIEKELKM